MSTTWESDEAVFHLFRSSSGQPADTNIRGWHHPVRLEIPHLPKMYSRGRRGSLARRRQNGANEALVSYWPLAVGIIIIV